MFIKNSYIAIYIDQGVYAVVVEGLGGPSKPRASRSLRISGDEMTPAVLEEIRSGLGTREASWVLVLSRGEYQFSRVEKPSVPDAELEQSLRWLVPLKDMNPQDTALSWVSVPPILGKSPQVYVAACGRAVIEARGQLFRSHRIDLRAVDIPEMAQRNIAARIPNARVVCLLAEDSGGLRVTITRHQDLFLERFIRESFQESFDVGDETCLKRIGIEIRRSLEFVRNAYPELSPPEIYVAPSESGGNLSALLAGELDLSVKNLDLRQIFDWPADSLLVDSRMQARFLPALGACLRL